MVIPSLEGWPTKTKEAPFPHEVRLSPVDINPVFLIKNEGGVGLFQISEKERLFISFDNQVLLRVI